MSARLRLNVVVLLIFMLAGIAQAATIAVIRDGPSEYLDARISGVVQEIEDLTGDRFALKYREFDGRWDSARVREHLQTTIDDPGVDLVYVAGALGAAAAAGNDLKKSVVVGVAQSSELIGLKSTSSGHSSATNLVFISLGDNFRQDLDAFINLVGCDIETQIRRRIALNIHQVLLGESPNSLKVGMQLPARLRINLATAETIGFHTPIDTLIQDLEWYTPEKPVTGEELTLEGAMGLAATNNIDVTTAESTVAVARGRWDRSRSAMLPQVYARSRYRQIDSDRAESSMGSEPERLVTMGAVIRQMLFDDGIITRYKTAGLEHRAAADQRESVRMDRITDAGNLYLRFLSALALYRIEKTDLSVTQQNLHLARVRQGIGRAGPGELLRWEAEEARRKNGVILTRQNIQIALTALNQSMGTDQAQTWRPRNIEIRAGGSYLLDNRFHQVVKSEMDVMRLARVSASIALERSPEIARIDKELDARRLIMARLKRRYYMPTITAAASYTNRLIESGEGTEFGLVLPGAGLSLPSSDDNEWSLTVDFTLPLFEGGGRAADIQTARAGIAQASSTREKIWQFIEQRTRSAVFALAKSWPSIFLFRKASKKAGENLNHVQELYAQGRANITHLTDAQSYYMRQQQRAALAVYGYLADLVAYQRAIGWFEWEKTDNEKAEMFGRLQ